MQGVEPWEDEDGEDEDGDRWLPVVCEGSREGYRDMEQFIATLDDAHLAELLEVAITGPGTITVHQACYEAAARAACASRSRFRTGFMAA